MSIELTDKARYDLEKENLTSVLLDFARRGHNPSEQAIMDTLNIDQETLDNLLAKLKNDSIIK